MQTADRVTPSSHAVESIGSIARQIPVGMIVKLSALHVRIFLLAAVALTLTGHWYVTSRHLLFGDPTLNHPYNIFGNWISDFAAVWPYGWWIKSGILALCVAALLFFRLLVSRLPDRTSRDVAVRVWWGMVATAVVTGLLMVAFFDRSPTRYSYDNPSWWARHIHGQHGEWRPMSETEPDRAKRWYHAIGFRLLACGCLLSTATYAVSQVRAGRRGDRTGAVLLFIMTATLTSVVWACMVKGFPWSGVPQRLLLCVILAWFWHVAGVLGNLAPTAGRHGQTFTT